MFRLFAIVAIMILGQSTGHTLEYFGFSLGMTQADAVSLALVVYVTERLQFRVGKRTNAPEEPCVDVILRKAMEQSLQSTCIRGEGRTYSNVGAGLKGDDTLLVNGIGGSGGEILIGPNRAILCHGHRDS
jgi:hypothetical protein